MGPGDTQEENMADASTDRPAGRRSRGDTAAEDLNGTLAAGDGVLGASLAMTPAAALARHVEWLDFALGAATAEERWRRERLTKATKGNRAKRTDRLAEVVAEIEELTALVTGCTFSSGDTAPPGSTTGLEERNGQTRHESGIGRREDAGDKGARREGARREGARDRSPSSSGQGAVTGRRVDRGFRGCPDLEVDDLDRETPPLDLDDCRLTGGVRGQATLRRDRPRLHVGPSPHRPPGRGRADQHRG